VTRLTAVNILVCSRDRPLKSEANDVLLRFASVESWTAMPGALLYLHTDLTLLQTNRFTSTK
jgi:hypothetical protein